MRNLKLKCLLLEYMLESFKNFVLLSSKDTQYFQYESDRLFVKTLKLLPLVYGSKFQLLLRENLNKKKYMFVIICII